MGQFDIEGLSNHVFFEYGSKHRLQKVNLVDENTTEHKRVSFAKLTVKYVEMQLINWRKYLQIRHS